MTKAWVAALILAAGIAFAGNSPRWNDPAPDQESAGEVALCMAAPPITEDPGVTCCCHTNGGGFCCAEATSCFGSFVPGCVCSAR
jgi:hypothetical protein